MGERMKSYFVWFIEKRGHYPRLQIRFVADNQE